ncbi:EAL domain-containing protein [Oryzibacter oryziterrae]|uniref:EAL domain-containing protein n=1 Tax=Oryzibacter oryziterrae TaxID=2766474 RepID=UPI001F1659CA|nr:EAL domain-containing protein [Oryzibacter oryziterrae]
MSRTNSILILIAMVVTAGSLAVVLDVQFGFPLAQAATLGLGFLFVLLLAQQLAERRKDRQWLETRIDEISAVAGDSNTEIAKLSSRLTRLEQTLALRVREENEPLAAEVEVVGHLLKQVAEGLAELETQVERKVGDLSARADAMAARQTAMMPPEPSRAEREPRRAEPYPMRQPESPAQSMQSSALFVTDTPKVPSAFGREVEKLIRSEAIELHLQPIVTLPQRKVRYYEVLTRLKGADGLINAAEFIPAAIEQRAIAKLDTFQVIRSFQILKRLTQRNSEVGLFVNLATESLSSSGFFREFQSFLSQNKAVADLVLFELSQSAMRDIGPLEMESLKAIADMGYRFSLDGVSDFRMDFRRLSDLGFRMVKVNAERLLGRQPVVTGDIHLEDMAGHMQRQGLTLIVDKVEQEGQVIDLLDYNITLAQGFLFSAPRQVRPEVLGAAAPAAPVTSGRQAANLR